MNYYESLKNLTVVILSRGRSKHLINTINYYDKAGIQLVVHHQTQFPIDTSRFTRLKYFPSQKDFLERCLDISESSLKDHAILSSDDELYTLSSLAKMSYYLSKNSRIQSIGGQAIAVSVDRLKIKTHFLYPDLISNTNFSDNLLSRVNKHFNPSNKNVKFSALYRMYRKDKFTQMMNLFAKNKGISTPYITEVSAECFALSIGKSSHLNEVYWIRNWINPPIQIKGWNRDITFYAWWYNSNFKSEHKIWIQNMNNLISKDKFQIILPRLLNNRIAEIYKKPIVQSNILKLYAKKIYIRILNFFKLYGFVLDNVDLIEFLTAHKIGFDRQELINGAKLLTKI